MCLLCWFNVMVYVFDWCVVVLLKYKLNEDDSIMLMFYDDNDMTMMKLCWWFFVDVGMHGQEGPMCMCFNVVVITCCESCIHVIGTSILIMLWPRSYGGDRVRVANSFGGE